MKLAIIILGVIILVLAIVACGLMIRVSTLEERCTELERQNRDTCSDISSLEIDVDLLKASAKYRKDAEIAAERKERMTNYLVVHASDSVTNRASALYDIATGKVIKEDK